jgi:hypothetical protein
MDLFFWGSLVWYSLLINILVEGERFKDNEDVPIKQNGVKVFLQMDSIFSNWFFLWFGTKYELKTILKVVSFCP